MHIPFVYRLCGGLLILALLLVTDLCRGKRQRAKEYLFLFGITMAAMLYGILHDYVSWCIGRDYFVIGKGIASAATHYSWETMKLAMGALWTVGLLGAACVLVGNNPDRCGRQVPYRCLVRLSAIPVMLSVVLETMVGAIFCLLAPRIAAATDLGFLYDRTGRPFFTVWGMHIGAYSGGGIGVAIAIAIILREKRRLPRAHPAEGCEP